MHHEDIRQAVHDCSVHHLDNSTKNWDLEHQDLLTLNPKQFAGQSITECTKAFSKKARDLKCAGLHNHTLMANLLVNLLLIHIEQTQ